MATCRDEIEALYVKHKHQDVGWEYNAALQSACTIGAFSCAYNMIALSVAMCQPITSVFPNMNGFQDNAYRVLNTTIVPKSCGKKPPVYLHWKKPMTPAKNSTPNHFVAVVPQRHVNKEVITISDSSDDDWPILPGTSGIACPCAASQFYSTTSSTPKQARCNTKSVCLFLQTVPVMSRPLLSKPSRLPLTSMFQRMLPCLMMPMMSRLQNKPLLALMTSGNATHKADVLVIH